MKYLVIDGELSGTGIRDKYESGYLVPEALGLSRKTTDRLNEWVSRYETEHRKGFSDTNVVDELDRQGKEIAFLVREELGDIKLEYFSAATMKSEMIG